jgi:hypothetical protein
MVEGGSLRGVGSASFSSRSDRTSCLEGGTLLQAVIRGCVHHYCHDMLHASACSAGASWLISRSRGVVSAPSPPRSHTIFASRAQPRKCATPKALRAPRLRTREASQPAKQQITRSSTSLGPSNDELRKAKPTLPRSLARSEMPKTSELARHSDMQ